MFLEGLLPAVFRWLGRRTWSPSGRPLRSPVGSSEVIGMGVRKKEVIRQLSNVCSTAFGGKRVGFFLA